MNKNTKNIFIAFIIGSSWLSVVLWFKWFQDYKNDDKFDENNCVKKILNLDLYYFYTIFAPVYIGFMCSCAIMISIYFKYSIRKSFFIISLISPLLVYIAINLCNVYNWTNERYREQLLRLFIFHSLLYNIINVTIYKMLVN